ncbi:MAG: hypothetical protein IPI88_11975 [Chitinophagaceae bacterium]|nr:hypothetical protein [Chitinophagaceae bacterium]
MLHLGRTFNLELLFVNFSFYIFNQQRFRADSTTIPALQQALPVGRYAKRFSSRIKGMNKQFIIRAVILTIFAIAYLVFTIRYYRKLKKNIVFPKNVKRFHQVMIWFVPFIWGLLLTSLTKSTPGSHEVENKEDPQPFSKTGGTMWTS